jgi:hypothetical protein
MGILSKLMGTAENTARGGRTERSAGRPAARGRGGMSTGRGGRSTGRARGASGGRAGTAASGGLGRLFQSFKRR